MSIIIHEFQSIQQRTRAQRVRYFQYQVGWGQVLKKSRVAGGLVSSRKVEIFDRVFPGTLFTLRYFGVLRVFRVDPKYGVLLDTKLYWVGYQDNNATRVKTELF